MQALCTFKFVTYNGSKSVSYLAAVRNALKAKHADQFGDNCVLSSMKET